MTTSTVPIAVVIPTYARGLRVSETLTRIYQCDPLPQEVWVHVDVSDGSLEGRIRQDFPDVKLLSSQTRLGPGGGRHRLLSACDSPFAASFDDDSYPVDADYFAKTVELFEAHPGIAVVGAAIWHPHEAARARRVQWRPAMSFTGCGHAIRLEAYKQVRGYVPRPVPYGIEETDVALQLFARNWGIIDSDELRVFHDTNLSHHASPELVSGTIANVGLYAFLNYPVHYWPYASLQVANKVVDCLRRGRIRGIASGLARIPWDCWRHRPIRRPVSSSILRSYLGSR